MNQTERNKLCDELQAAKLSERAFAEELTAAQEEYEEVLAHGVQDEHRHDELKKLEHAVICVFRDATDASKRVLDAYRALEEYDAKQPY